MKQCKICLDADSCGFDWRDPYCEYMNCTEFKKPLLTNADRIRAMTGEELADWLCRHIRKCSECVAEGICEHTGVKANGLLKWLKQEAKDG